MDAPENPAAAIWRHMMIRESIASVALSHPEDCSCDVCKAATGDDDALARIIDRLSP